MIVVTDVGLLQLLDATRPFLNTLLCGLFINNRVPVRGDTLASFTEPTFTNYARIPTPDWRRPYADPDGNGRMIYPRILTWTSNGTAGAELVYGYLFLDPRDNLAWAERFPLPVSVQLNGALVDLQPRLLDRQWV